MVTTKRFEQAIAKLYNAFNHGTLQPECCKQCAVGTITNNTDAWRHLSDHHGSLELNYVGKVHEMFGKRIQGYLPSEILKIEAVFLNACGYGLPLHHQNKRPAQKLSNEILFVGLTAVIELLCEFDGIKNVMDYTAVFKELTAIKDVAIPVVY